jgi:hypothetical protein
MLHKRGFARAGVTDDADKLSPFYGERNITQRYMLKGRTLAIYVI